MRYFARAALSILLCLGAGHGCLAAEEMAREMQMNDGARLGKAWLDQLEWRGAGEPNIAAFEGEGWYGDDYNKLWLRGEGDAYSGRPQQMRAEVLWDRIATRWWSLEAGVREDWGVGPSRGWAALGLRGLAPQDVNVEATVYAGSASRTAARLKIEYEVLFTQQLILQPELEMNLYGKADRERNIGAGLSDLEVGLRLRYEVRRELAPYAGVVWARQRGAGADSLHAPESGAGELRLAVGLRVWL